MVWRSGFFQLAPFVVGREAEHDVLRHIWVFSPVLKRIGDCLSVLQSSLAECERKPPGRFSGRFLVTIRRGNFHDEFFVAVGSALGPEGGQARVQP